jgi:hypothetical protein
MVSLVVAAPSESASAIILKIGVTLSVRAPIVTLPDTPRVRAVTQVIAASAVPEAATLK